MVEFVAFITPEEWEALQDPLAGGRSEMLQLSDAVRNIQAGALHAACGPSAILQVRTGPPPADCAAADTGTLLASMALPATWMTTPVAGTTSKTGTWEDPIADASGDAGHFRIKDTTATACHAQGRIATSDAEMILADGVTLTAGLPFRVQTFQISAGNA